MADPQLGFFAYDKDFVRETELFEKAIAHANRLKPAFVVICGDLVNKPGDEEQIAEFLRICEKLNRNIPLYLVSGNHDIGNNPTAESIKFYRSTFGNDQYSFRHDRCYGIVINSTILCSQNNAAEELAKQFEWVQEELKKISIREPEHIFVFLHHPLFLENPEEEDSYFNVPQKWRALYLQLFSRYNVTAIFAGHYHRNSCGQYGQLEMITTGPVGKPLGKDPSGFRIVVVSAEHIKHRYYDLDEIPETVKVY